MKIQTKLFHFWIRAPKKTTKIPGCDVSRRSPQQPAGSSAPWNIKTFRAQLPNTSSKTSFCKLTVAVPFLIFSCHARPCSTEWLCLRILYFLWSALLSSHSCRHRNNFQSFSDETPPLCLDLLQFLHGHGLWLEICHPQVLAQAVEIMVDPSIPSKSSNLPLKDKHTCRTVSWDSRLVSFSIVLRHAPLRNLVSSPQLWLSQDSSHVVINAKHFKVCHQMWPSLWTIDSTQWPSK